MLHRTQLENYITNYTTKLNMVQLLFSLKSIPKYKQKEKMLIYRQQANIHKRLSHEHKKLAKNHSDYLFRDDPGFHSTFTRISKFFLSAKFPC